MIIALFAKIGFLANDNLTVLELVDRGFKYGFYLAMYCLTAYSILLL